ARVELWSILARLTSWSLCRWSALRNTQCGIGQLDFHLSGEDHQGGKPPLLIEAVQVLGAEDWGLAGNGRVARPVNTSFPIRPDAERSEQLKPFDKPGEVLLKGRLWPFPQPSKRGASLAVGDLD